MSTSNLIITPDDQEFWDTLSTAMPPGWRGEVTSDFTGHFACRVGSWLVEPIEGRQYGRNTQRERDFSHLKNNYETLSNAFADAVKDQDLRFDRLDLSQVRVESKLDATLQAMSGHRSTN